MRALFTAALTLAAAPAIAHEGDHTQMAAGAAARHLLASADHLLVLGLVTAIVALPLARLALARVRR